MRTPRLLSQLTHDLPEEGQLVVYDSRGEKLVVLNEVGAAIYFLIDGEKSSEDIARFVSDALPPTDGSDSAVDVERFLDELVREGIVEWCESPKPAPEAP